MTESWTTLELRSTATRAGRMELAVVEAEVGAPADHEVVVRMEASPINPSDLGLLLGPADMATLSAGGTPDGPTLSADIPDWGRPGMASRLDQSMPVGNEGAGTVVAAGKHAAQLMGRKVGLWGGGMYTRFRKVRAMTSPRYPTAPARPTARPCSSIP